MKILTYTAQTLLVLSATALLMACGSGNNIATTGPGSEPLVPGTDIPVSATTDSATTTEFIRSVVALGEADTGTPLIVGDVVLATSDSADPAAI